MRSVLLLVSMFCVACGGNAPKPDVQSGQTPIPAKQPAAEPKVAETPEKEADEAKAVAEDGETPEVPEAPKLTPEQEAALDQLAEGRRAVADGDAREAASKFRDALRSDPNLADAQYNLGVLAEWQGDLGSARQEYEKTLSIDPEHEPAVTAIANMMLRKGNRGGALAYTQQALARKPDSLSLRNAVNRVHLLHPNRHQQVILDTKKILRADEKNVSAMINLAAAYFQQGKHELTIAILENAKALEPHNPEIRARAALAHQALGEKLRARLVLEEAAELPGGATPEVHNNLGLLYHAAGDYEGAASQFEKALAKWPDMIAAQINLGNSLKGQQRYTDAVKALLKALKLDPNSPDAYFNLGILYLDGDIPEVQPQRRFEKAVTYFEKYKTLRKSTTAKDPVEEYITEAKRRIEVEKKRAEQARRQPKTPPPEDGEGDGEGEDDGEGDDADDDEEEDGE
jgi:tetratricopeptide (TPR) repeat protein